MSITKRDLRDALRGVATKKDLERLVAKGDLRDLNVSLTRQLAQTKKELVAETSAEIGKLHDVVVTRPQLEQLIGELHRHGVKVDRKTIFAD